MKIVGLDLSTTRCGFASMSLEGELLAIGYHEPVGSICDKLVDIADWLSFVVASCEDDVVVGLEYPRGWSSSVLIALGRVNGLVHFVCRSNSLVKDLFELDPCRGKSALSEKGNANKDMQVESFLAKYPNWIDKRRLIKPNPKLEGKITDDEADACGIALAVLQRRPAVYASSTGKKEEAIVF